MSKSVTGVVSQFEELTPQLQELQTRFAQIDLLTRERSGDSDYLEFLVLRRDHVAIRLYKEQGHQRPHFHIKFKNEYQASFALDDFSQLSGHIPPKYLRDLLQWARENQNVLLKKWNELNDSIGCELAINGDTTWSTRSPGQ